MSATPRHRVVVVGGGFGGLPAARLLSRSDVEVTLIDQRNHHLFQPLLYQVATGIMSPGEISPVLRHMLRHRKNVTVVLAKVTGFDLATRVVHTESIPGEGNDYPYDSLIVAAGAGQSYFGHDEFALDRPGDEDDRRRHGAAATGLGALEIAETLPRPGPTALLHDLRDRRGRPDRRGAGGPDPRARLPEPDPTTSAPSTPPPSGSS